MRAHDPPQPSPSEEASLQIEEATNVLKVLGNRVRLLILLHLCSGEHRAGDLVELPGLPQSVISQHLSMLRHEHTVQFRREGLALVYSIWDPRMKDLLRCVSRLFR